MHTFRKTKLIAGLLVLWLGAGSAQAAGIPGPIGPAGLPGLKGVKGDIGPQGLKGDKGAAGAQGLKGDKGVAGAAGARGPAGSSQAGNDVGDMQYWDGSQWQVLSAPAFTAKSTGVATLHYCKNALAPTWQDICTPANTTVYQLGDYGPAGGRVIYLSDNTGLHGLEAAPADQATATAGCEGTSIFGGHSKEVGTGAANTAAIIAGCNESGTAAKIADNYVLNGFTDWFLPSIDELNLVFIQRDVIGGFTYGWYSSSTEYNATKTLSQSFSNDVKNYYSKSVSLSVRAIRAF